ncbi:transposase [Mesorhizobium newzealandense]|uniref:Transposase n=3 Tax=Mesorhizobium TaxID=68287 RepID=A0ABW4U6P2_9HYPH
MIAERLKRWNGHLAKVGLETGSMTPWLYHELKDLGFPVICMDARRAADALKARPEKTDKADAQALAEILASGLYSAVHVKTMESHRLKALLGAREQLVNVKRQLYGQVRGLLRNSSQM